MSDENREMCPECSLEVPLPSDLDRRGFIRAVSGGAAAVAGSAALTAAQAGFAAPAEVAKKQTRKPAEDLIRELHASLSPEQKKELVHPWDHGGNGRPSRLRTYNSAALGKRIGQHYTKAQQELVQKTLRAILSSDEAYQRITRNGKWDNSRSFDGNAAVIFGDPTGKRKFSWVFAGHHLNIVSKA